MDQVVRIDQALEEIKDTGTEHRRLQGVQGLLRSPAGASSLATASPLGTKP